MRKLFVALFVLVSFLDPSGTVSAEITSPYTLDEKAQVIFGDSVEIVGTSTYYGLENYVTEYVDNYLRITFTYTHAGVDTFCCYASYPPVLYVTGLDPRSTTTPSVRDSQTVYALLPKPIPPGHATDWYLYDIQFDATGYTVVVRQAGTTEVANFHRDISGITTSDYVALANNSPRAGNSPTNTMSFAPLLIYQAPEEPPVTVATTTPVIIVPGITSSVLSNGQEVWPNTTLMALSFEDLYLDDLILSTEGENINLIQADSIIRILLNNDFFAGLFSRLGSDGYAEDEDWFEFPYDWRLDIESSSLELKEKIDSVRADRGVDRVDLVAHSMGGLLVKKYLKDFGGDSVGKFIDIGTPHTGSPKAFKLLNYGDNFDASFLFGLLGLNAERLKIISQNMPAVYQLLPSQKYFDSTEYYVWNGVGDNNRLSFGETQNYLVASGRNSALVTRASEFHQEIDDLNPSDYGVETYNIVSCGVPTIGQFYILDDDVDDPIYNIRMIDGDGTVPLVSAKAMSAGTTYYVSGVQHAVMPSASGVKELVAGLLSSGDTFDISPYASLSTSSGGCGIPDGRIVSFHSPIELHIYDSFGNHTGPDANGDIENGINGVVYEVIDGNKFAYLPNGVEYTVRGGATGSGTFDVRIQELVGGEVVNTQVFADLPLTPVTQAQFALGASLPTQVDLDGNDDGIYEGSYGITTSASGILESTGKLVRSVVSQSPTEESSSRAVSPTRELERESLKAIEDGEVGTPPVVEVDAADLRYVGEENILSDERVEATGTVSRNVATVYKSIGYKFMIGVLKGWLWFISKL